MCTSQQEAVDLVVALELRRVGGSRRVQLAKQGRQEQPVVIAADKNARYEDVLSVLDLLQRNGVKKVGLLARPPAT